MPYVYIEAEDILEKINDDELIEEIERRGYFILRKNATREEVLKALQDYDFWVYPKTSWGQYPAGFERVRHLLLRLGLKEDAQNEALALICEITQESSSFFHSPCAT